MEARYSLRKSVRLLVIVAAVVAIQLAFLAFGGPHYPTVWFAAAIGVLVAARGLDRRVKLRIGPEGLWYAPWGASTILWGELDSISTFEAGRGQFVAFHPRFPQQVRERMPLISRVNSSINERFGRPAFYINPNVLEASAEDILLHVQQAAGPAA